ncbi:MAG: hypothetical protein OCD01_00500 [Fibrobacterales bacterium]
MSDRRQEVIEEYRKSDIMTAGSLKSYEKLLDRAVVLMKSFKEGDGESQIQIQNILSQVQSSLNLKQEPAQLLFASIAPIWDVVETGDRELIDKASSSVEYLRETVRLLMSKSK